MPTKEDIKHYCGMVARHWVVMAVFVLLSVATSTQTVIQSIQEDFVMPAWVWVAIIFIGLFIAQFLAWRDIKRERDLLRKYDVSQQTLSDLANLRDRLISHQNTNITSGTELGQWIEQFLSIRREVNAILQERVSYAEHRAYDHIGLFVLYEVPPTGNLTEHEHRQYVHWRSRIGRDHKWIEKFIHDYSRYRMRADLEAISGQDPTSETGFSNST